MLTTVRTFLFGVATLAFLIVSLLLYFIPFLLIALLKLPPIAPLRRLATAGVARVATGWIGLMNAFFRALRIAEWHISGTDQLSPQRNYLVIGNHQTWADILVLLYAINGITPPFRFFLKRDILYMPVIGFVCWALDMPFMRRYTRAQLERAPQKRDDDFIATRHAMQQYRTQRVTVINYAEGTRLTAAKHAAQQSPYRYLLRPKAGGVGMVLGSMGDYLDAILDVTVAYDGGGHFWRFMSGQIPHIYVHIETLPVPPEFVGRDYLSDVAYQTALRDWINARWAIKDQHIAALLAGDPPK